MLMAFVPSPDVRAQEDLSISGSYQHESLLSFIESLESHYPVRFYFDPKSIENIFVTASFQETSLTKCLETIMNKEGLKFYIMDNHQVIIYTGTSINELRTGQQPLQVIRKEPSAEEKLSRERLRRLQFQLIDIGTPGSSTSGYARVSGYLTCFETGKPVSGGNIYISETQRGVISNQEGYYEIRLPLGNQTISFSSIDMNETKRIINLYSDGRLDVVMETKYNLLEDVVVVGHGKGNLGQIHLGLEEITLKKLRAIPTLFGEPDVVKSLITLPGVQTVGEGTSGYNVRGGKTDQNLILIDQAPIYYPSHFFGNFSAINADIIRDAVLYKGSMPVKYGGRISSVLQIYTKGGETDKFSGAGGISPLSAHLSLEGPLFSRKSAFLVSGRTTYSNWLLDFVNVPDLYKSKVDFYDVQAKLNLYINEKNRLLVSYYRSKDGFQLRSDTIYRYVNNIASLSWENHINDRIRLEYKAC